MIDQNITPTGDRYNQRTNEESASTVQISHYIQILWARKWVIILTTILTIIVAILISLLTKPTYHATAVVRILTTPTGDTSYVQYDTNYSDRLMNTYSQLMSSKPVLGQVMQKLNLTAPPQVELKILANTELIEISSENGNPVVAMDIANALADILVSQSRALYVGTARSTAELLKEQLTQAEKELAQARSNYDDRASQAPENASLAAIARQEVTIKEDLYNMLRKQYVQAQIRDTMRANTISIVTPATQPSSASGPNKLLIAGTGLMLGLLAGTALAFLFENLDTRLYTLQDIEQESKLATLGAIPTDRKRRWSTLAPANSLFVEAFRRSRANIFSIVESKALQTLMVTSAEPREGKSTVVANLAIAIAQAGRTVVVIDSDLRLPAQHLIFHLPNEIGLGDVLRGNVQWASAIRDTDSPSIKILTSGSAFADYELLSSVQMIALLEQLKQEFDIILVDTPAYLAVSDAAELAPKVDGVLLVTACAWSHQRAVQVACQQLSMIGVRPIGVIVNRAKQNKSYLHSAYSAAKN